MTPKHALRRKHQREVQLRERKAEHADFRARIKDLQNRADQIDAQLGETDVEEYETAEQLMNKKVEIITLIEEERDAELERAAQFEANVIELDSEDMRFLRGEEALRNEIQSRIPIPKPKPTFRSPSPVVDKDVLHAGKHKLKAKKQATAPLNKSEHELQAAIAKTITALKALQQQSKQKGLSLQQQQEINEKQLDCHTKLEKCASDLKQIDSSKQEVEQKNALSVDERRVLRGEDALYKLPSRREARREKKLREQYQNWKAENETTAKHCATPDLSISQPELSKLERISVVMKQRSASEITPTSPNKKTAKEKALITKWALSHPTYLKTLLQRHGLTQTLKIINESQELTKQDKLRGKHIVNQLFQQAKDNSTMRATVWRSFEKWKVQRPNTATPESNRHLQQDYTTTGAGSPPLYPYGLGSGYPTSQSLVQLQSSELVPRTPLKKLTQSHGSKLFVLPGAVETPPSPATTLPGDHSTLETHQRVAPRPFSAGNADALMAAFEMQQKKASHRSRTPHKKKNDFPPLPHQKTPGGG
eukprot:TRINITY_DN66780_c2_g8_i1.p1 TRINITY_DN66780_c2_g8~~TRINITY_DN66780_c2_g8_i1.p1  ORF type:complete len:536 (+),score=59.80 TRINITY_DN66780_c2_g8_i1:76-1683(+)